mgnify:CR=1 FL=1
MNREASTDGAFGREAGKFVAVCSIWANVSFTKGKKAMNEGAIDAYDYFMIRCDFHSLLKEESHLSFDGHEYQIESFHADKQANEMQITCVRLQK